MRSIRSAPASRAGERAREQLVEAAGAVFAEKGYSSATSREICDRAGMNGASVNYHFGGIEALYAEVWRLANDRIATLQSRQAIANSKLEPFEKLRAYLSPIIEWLAQPMPKSWEMRLLCRELVSPSPLRDMFTRESTIPKINAGKAILAEFFDTTADDPVVARAMVMVIAPCILMGIYDQGTLDAMIPAMGENPKTEGKAFAAQYERFIRAGLEAVACDRRGQPTKRRAKAKA